MRFGTLEKVYENISDPAIRASMRKKLEEGRDLAFLSRELARINRDVPLEDRACHLQKSPSNDTRLYNLLSDFELKGAIARLGLKEPENINAEISSRKNQVPDLVCGVDDITMFEALLTAGRLFVVMDESEGGFSLPLPMPRPNLHLHKEKQRGPGLKC